AAGARVEANLATFDAIARALALPYIALRRPEWDKFPGAYYSIGLDIPLGGARTLQIGTVHHYRENFSRPYGIDYEDPQGVQRPVHQTTFGLSERLLGAVVAVHGDRNGVVFPSAIAPYQVILVPILGGSGASTVTSTAAEIRDRLTTAGLRVRLDDGDERP
ncbi:prolyl-tRNA synthetase, partial [mine drainage metagenome]